jgi:hypothetical protein
MEVAILDVVEETNQMLEGMVDVAVLEILKEGGLGANHMPLQPPGHDTNQIQPQPPGLGANQLPHHPLLPHQLPPGPPPPLLPVMKEHPDLEVEMASDLHHDWEVEEVVDVVLVALYVVSLVAQAAS